MYRRLSIIKLSVFLIIAALSGLTTTQAQESVQIDILNVPQVLSSPFVSDLENDVRGGRYQVQLNYISTDIEPVELEFEVQLYRNGELLVEEVSRPATFNPGVQMLSPIFDNLDFDRNLDQILRDLDGNITQQVLQTGTLPQGDYRIILDARPVERDGPVVHEGRTRFSVNYPQPPQVTAPADEANVTMANPVFTWTPVMTQGNFMMEYEFLLVEIFEGQSPEEAIDANRAQSEQTLFGENMLVYTDDQLPLEEGVRYAWQVTAYELNDELPIRNDGESEVYTFTYRDADVDPGELADLEEIELVPDVAVVTDLNDIKAESTAGAYELNGPVTVELNLPDIARPVNLRADLQNLRIHESNLEQPVVMGGGVRMDPAVVNRLLGRYFPAEILELQYTFGEGIRAQAAIQTKHFGQFRSETDLMITQNGLEGTLRASAGDAGRFEEGPVILSLNEIILNFPDPEVTASASLEIDNFDAPCNVYDLNINESTWRTGIYCEEFEPVTLLGDEQAVVRLKPGQLKGDIRFELEEQELSYNLKKDAQITVNQQQEEICKAHFRAGYETGEQMEINTIRQRCDQFNGGLQLGFAEVFFRNPQITNFEAGGDEAQWDFELTFDSRLKLNLFGGWESPWMDNTTISRSGLSFEEQAFTQAQHDLPNFELDGINARLQQFLLENVDIPIGDEEGVDLSIGEFDAEITLIEGGPGGMPSCIVNSQALLQNGNISLEQATADIEVDLNEVCEWQFGAGYAIAMESVEGQAGATWQLDRDDPDIQPYADFSVNGDFSTGDPFECTDEITSQNISLAYGSGLIGTLEDIHPACPAKFGPFIAEFNESTLELDWSEDEGQQGELEGEATVDFAEETGATGSITIDIMDGTMKDGQITLDEPFYWEIPKDDAILTFRISEASLDKEGLHIDGRHDFIVGEEEIGVTFDQLLLDVESMQIKSGQILFDEQFALEAGITEDDELDFNALPTDTTTTLEPGLYMELGTEIAVDSSGLATSGQAYAEVFYNEQEFDSNITVEYSDNFRINLAEFEVTSGQADIYLNDSRIALIDPAGFHPDFTYFAEMLIPEKLPLPTVSTAYVRLRDENDELLVESTQTEDGELAVSTIPDESLTLYVPAWDETNPPELADVELDDVVLGGNPATPVMVEGSVTAQVNDGDDLYDLTDRDIPLQLNRLVFGDAQPESSQQFTHLYFEGHLNLFENELNEPGEVGFYLDQTGTLEADLEIDGFEQQIPLMPGSDIVMYTLMGLEGEFETDLDGLTDPSFSFDLSGLFEVDDGQNVAASTGLDLAFNTNGLHINYYDGEIDDLPHFDLGLFGMEVNEIENFPSFSYSEEEGFNFKVGLDLNLHFDPAHGESFHFPLEGVEIRDDGLMIPDQEVDSSTMPGLDLPEFELMGMEFKPLALRTYEDFVVDWYQDGWSFDFEPMLDFELHLPEFADTAINPPDGLTFSNVGFDDGYLVGSVQTHMPLGNTELPLIPGYDESPVVSVDSVDGSFEREVIDGEPEQEISLYVHSKLQNLPVFEHPDDECTDEPDLQLEIIEGSGFSGSLEDFTPCGEIEMGPLALDANDSELNITYTDDEQEATLAGTMEATLPAPDDEEITATGSGEVNLLTGRISDGSISITEDFQLGYGPADDPVFDLTMSQATLDSAGIEISGTGNAGTDEVSVDVTFDELRFGIPEFGITDGSATLQPNLAFQVGTDLSEMTISETEDDLDGENVFRYVADQQVVIDRDGVTFAGTGSAGLIYQGEEFFGMDLNFEDDFAIQVGSYGINASQGRAEAYLTDQDGPDDFDDEEPMIIWDAVTGLSIGGGILAVLPDRLGLPTEDIAYVDLVDEDGDELIDLESLDQGGYELSTGDDTLPVVIPALEGEDSPPSVEVGFNLETDDEYNLVGGSFSVEEGDETDLTSQLDLPVKLTDLDLNTEDGEIRLEAGILADLPAVFEEHQAEATLVLDQADGIEATIEAGTYTDSWDGSLDGQHLYEYTYDDDLGSGETDMFAARLYGIQLHIGPDPELGISAGLKSSLITPPDGDGAHTLFLAAAYEEGQWDGTAEYDWPHESTDIGFAEFLPEKHEAVSVDIGEDEFIVGINGILDFEDMLGEDFLIDVDDLRFGVDGVQSSPGLVFSLGEATASLPDQQFEFFEGALAGEFSGIALGISQRALILSSEDGDVNFFDEELEYDEFMVSTAGEFSIDNIGTDGFELFEDYVVLDGIGVGYDQQEGMELASNFTVTLPDPVDEGADASIVITRDSEGKVSIDAEGPEFDFENKKYEIGNFAEFRLDDAGVGLEVTNPQDSYFFANGAVLMDDDEVITLGNPGNGIDEAGISFKPSRSGSPLQYDAEGKKDFEFDRSFFEIYIQAEAIANNDGSDQSTFKLVLGGEAGVDINKVSGRIGYEGFTVSTDGVEDIGNFDGTGELEIKNKFKLEIGKFYRATDPDGMEITIGTDADVDTDDDTQVADKLEEGGAETVQVTEILCFGAHPDIDTGEGNGCGTDNDALNIFLGGEAMDGAFTAGIGGVLFYEVEGTGDRRIELNDIYMNVEEVLEIQGSMQYESGDPGMMLRVSATGEFEIGEGGSTMAAMVVGAFDTTDDLTFGLFAAAEAQDLAVPIVPGVIEMFGLGGGFFYNPDNEDINFIHEAIEGFGHDLVAPDKAPSTGDDVTGFAAMLYTSIGLIGSSGQYAIEGGSFLQVTEQGLYIDASGTVLGLDGDGTPGGLVATAGGYLSIQIDLYDPSFHEFLLQGGVTQTAYIPNYIDADGEIHFFAGKSGEQSDLVWGIQGEKDVSIYGNMMNGNATFIASDIGFFFEGGLTIGGALDDIPVVDFEANLMASVWYTTPESELELTYPLGGYGSADVELCVGLCADAEIKGAIVQHHVSGIEMFASAKAEVASKEISGWVSISSGPEVSAGKGELEGDIIDETQGYKEEFEDYVEDLLTDLESAQEAIEAIDVAEYAPSDEDIAGAGYNLFSMNSWKQDQWMEIIIDNEESSDEGIRSDLNGMLHILLQDMFDQEVSHEYTASQIETYADVLSDYLDNLSDDVVDNLENIIEEAEDIEGETEDSYEELVDAIDESPVQSWADVPTSDFQNQAPDFQLDEATANEQAEQVEDHQEVIGEMALAMLEPIELVEELLSDMDQAMFDQQVSSAEVGDLYIELNPSVLGYARMYMSNIVLIDQYHAYEANKRWVEALDAERRYELIDMGDFPSSVAELTDRLNNMWINEEVENYEKEQEVTANRLNILLHLTDNEAPGNFQGVGATPYDNVTGLYDDLDYQTLVDAGQTPSDTNVGVHNENFWWNMFMWGLDEVTIQRALDIENNVFSSYQDSRPPMVDALRSLTSRIEDFYDVNQNTYAMYYAMLDNLELRVADIVDDLESDVQDEVNTYLDKHSEVAEMLQPPKVEELMVTHDRPSQNFYNRVNVDWSASHPHGLVETSIRVQNPSGAEYEFEDMDEFLSIGTATEHPIYVTRTEGLDLETNDLDDPNFNTKNLSVEVKVRGPAGSTASRTADFNVDVGPDGEAIADGSNVLPNPDQISAPETPESLMEEQLNIRDVLIFDGLNFPSNQEEEQSEEEPPEGTLLGYWTNNPDLIEISVRSYSEDVSIKEFEYAVGSSRGEYDIIDWRTLPGSIVPDGGDYDRIDGESAVISLEEGEEYYVSVRAINNLDMTSPPRELRAPVRYDPTAPEDIDDEGIFVADKLGYLGQMQSFGSTDIEVTNPIFGDNLVFQALGEPDDKPSGPQVDPAIAVGWTPSSDDNSGLLGYECVVTGSGQISESQFEALDPEFCGDVFMDSPYEIFQGKEGSKYEDVITNFEDEVFAHVRPVDFAGNAGDILSIGQVPLDPVDPAEPEMRVRPLSSGFTLYLRERSYDLESGLKGYEYSIGTQKGATDVRDWPDDGVDLAVEDAESGVPSIKISDDELTEGQQVYVNYRAVNNQGNTSEVKATGPVVLDTDSPEFPGIEYDIMTSSWTTQPDKIGFTISNIHDEVSGVLKAEYKLTDGENETQWRTLFDNDLPVTDEVTISRYVNIPWYLNSSSTYVKARVTNATMLQQIAPAYFQLTNF